MFWENDGLLQIWNSAKKKFLVLNCYNLSFVFQALKDLYTHLTPIQRVSIARHPNRPTFLDHVFSITEKVQYRKLVNLAYCILDSLPLGYEC